MNKEYIHTQVQLLHEQGYTIRSIADEIGISKSNVGRIVKELHNAVLGTNVETCPQHKLGTSNVHPGTAAEPVPISDWDVELVQNKSLNSGMNAVESLKHNAQDSLIANQEVWKYLKKDSLQTRYRNFLDSTYSFFSNNLGSEELALSLIKSRQSRVVDFINFAIGICTEFSIPHEKLYMYHVMGQLHAFLEQPELVKSKYELTIKNCSSIKLMLREAGKLDVFALK